MALLGMPVLLLNMGGEMVYILEQRLQAQSINPEKSKRVLQDVVRTMFNAKFIEELMKPQDLYSLSSLRGIFDRLAHSSIMRLSESSMDKLFDLMTMGVKYQVVCSTYPGELVDVTLNHIDSMRTIVDDKTLESLIDSFRDQFKKRYENLSVGEFMELRQTLHSFFQDRRIKVSLFLQEGLQTTTGTMVFPEEEFLPPGVLVPNTIRYYTGGETKTVPIPYSGKAKVRSQPVRSKLGLNLYLKSRQPSTQATTPAASAPSTSTTPAVPSPSDQPAAAAAGAAPSVKEIETPDLKPTSKLGAAELNLLAQLVGQNSPDVDKNKDTVRVNLFAGDTWGQFEVSNVSSIPTVVIDPTHEKNQHIKDLMSNMDINSGSSGDGKDLLELMDSAS